MNAKTRILEAAATLLSQSSEADFSTRAVCEAAGVGAPLLYRQFGDKDGLLAAVVDFGFERYLATKRAFAYSADPVQDLRNGWDNHVAFAVQHPNYYKLMYSPGLTARPEAAAEAQQLLLAVVERAAAAGRLTAPTQLAAQMIMSANVGVGLSLIYRPELNTDPTLSARVRDAVIDSVTTLATDSTAGDRSLQDTATTLGAQLRASSRVALTPTETALLQDWLDRLAAAP